VLNTTKISKFRVSMIHIISIRQQQQQQQHQWYISSTCCTYVQYVVLTFITMSSKFFTSDPTDCLEPIVGTSGAQSLAAINPLTLFQSTVGRHPRAVALALKRPVNGVIPSQWKTWTFQQYWNECVSFAKSLLSLGVAQFDVVNIIGFNSVGASCYVYYHQFCH
jgi:hypothetical protein